MEPAATSSRRYGPARDAAAATGRRPNRREAVVAAAVATGVAGLGFACALAIAPGGAATDPGLVPIVRFMGGTKLALALLVGWLAIVRYARPERRRRLIAGAVASGAMAFGAGLIWSGTGFAGGFAAFASGLAVAALLAIKELEASLKRRP